MIEGSLKTEGEIERGEREWEREPGEEESWTRPTAAAAATRRRRDFNARTMGPSVPEKPYRHEGPLLPLLPPPPVPPGRPGLRLCRRRQ